MMDAIENSLISACKNHFGTSDNIKVIMDRDTCDYAVYAEKKRVVEEVKILRWRSVSKKRKSWILHYRSAISHRFRYTQKSLGVLRPECKEPDSSKIREEERKVVFDQYFEKEKDIVTGIVQRYVGKNVSINLGKADAMLTENEQVKGEHFKPTERIKLYVVEVKKIRPADRRSSCHVPIRNL